MPQCKRCLATIRWQGLPGRWTMLNQDGTAHQCPAPKTCRYCEKPIVWLEYQGKRQCFEPDEKTLHLDVCAHRDECLHCGRKMRWTLVEGKWVAFDSVITREPHAGLCPKDPAAAKALIRCLAELETENARLRELLPGAPIDIKAPTTTRAEVTQLRAEVTRLKREMAYRDVELRRLTLKAEGRTKRRA